MGYVVDKETIETDHHFEYGCSFCHEGDADGVTKAEAHKGMVKRPSDNLDTCGVCHEVIAATYKLSLHYTTAGFKNGVSPRFSQEEKTVFYETVFEQSCRIATLPAATASDLSCPASKPASWTGIRFVRKDESKSCALCHGGRIYPELPATMAGAPMSLSQRLTCLDCHSANKCMATASPTMAVETWRTSLPAWNAMKRAFQTRRKLKKPMR